MKFFSTIKSQLIYGLKFLGYLITSRHWGGYSIHSPFMFRFYKRVLWPGRRKELKRVRSRVRLMKRDQRLISCDKVFGAGSGWVRSGGERLSRIVRHSSIHYKYGKVLYSLVREFRPSTILELGTSVGISTMYLAEGCSNARIFTLEGCPEKMAVSRENAEYMGYNHIRHVQGEFSHELPKLLPQIGPLDLVFIDGDHRKDQTTGYFKQLLPWIHSDSIVILDDIHWSDQMTRAWETIISQPGVRVSVDLFRMGILLFKKELSPQRFQIRY